MKTAPEAAEPGHGPREYLDLETALRITQAVGDEHDLDRLIDTFMRLALEYGCADRGLLILRDGVAYRTEAVALNRNGAISVTLLQKLISEKDLPEPVMRHVIDAREVAVIDDAISVPAFSSDSYIQQRKPRRIICLPLIKASHVVGMLYLESGRSTDGFSAAGLSALKLLTSYASALLGSALRYQQVQETEAFLAEAQRLGHIGSFRWNTFTDLVSWSDETYRIFELDKSAQASLKLVQERTHPSDIQHFTDVVEEARRQGTDFAVDHRISSASGGFKHIHVAARATRDRAGTLEFVGAVMDISQSKQAEEALRKAAQAELMHATRLTTMGALAASIAHEVNQPLMAIVTNAAACQQWLERDQPDLVEARKAAARVIRNGHLAGGVIRSVYQLAKRSPPKMTRLDVNAAIRETIDILRGQMSRHDVLLALDLRPDLPDVVGDKTQIQQLVLNLALNGIEAMASISGRTRQLRISSDVDHDGLVLVTVEDTGPGIDAQVMERLFEPLFTTKPEGMGMGLSICRSVIEAHGGRLWAAPKASGSLFLFTLPIEPNE